MASNAYISGLTWDVAQAEAVCQSHLWIFSAMQTHGPELVKMLWRILGNEQDVCDAYQDTFVKLANYAAGRKPKHVRAYIFKTACNTAMSMLRHKINERKMIHCAEEIRPPVGGDIDSASLQEELRRCIAQLPQRLREVVTLHDLAELPYDQVSRILKITTGTARVYRCKAVQLLSVLMNREQD